jgi:hypothetical protein
MRIKHHKSSDVAVFVAFVLLGVLGCIESDSPKDSRNGAGLDHPQSSDQVIGDLEASSDEISSVVDAIFRSINEGKAETLYETATAPKFREVASLVAFESICERVQSRLGTLLSKQSSRLDLNPMADSVVASASFQAQFEHGAGTIFVVLERQGDEWLLLRLNVNAPELLDDPTQFREMVEVFVVDSDPVLPGSSVDILDTAFKPPKAIAESVSVVNVRWKVTDPSSKPRFPARGFVTIGLTKDQANAVKGVQTLSVRRHAENPGQSDDLP